MTDAAENNISPDEYVDSLGLSFTATRIPNRTDNWSSDWDKDAYHFAVTISNENGSWYGNYSMGSGHRIAKPFAQIKVRMGSAFRQEDYDRITSPGFKPRTVYDENAAEIIFEPPRPVLVDVLWSLVRDSEAIEYNTFEEWADDSGHDTDSRIAESIYHACVSTGLVLRQMFNNDGLEKLRAIYQDY